MSNGIIDVKKVSGGDLRLASVIEALMANCVRTYPDVLNAGIATDIDLHISVDRTLILNRDDKMSTFLNMEDGSVFISDKLGFVLLDSLDLEGELLDRVHCLLG